MKNSDVVTCKTCVHCRVNWLDRTFNINPSLWKCSRNYETHVNNINLITGEKNQSKVIYPYCSSERTYGGDTHCGDAGKFWQPKNTKKYLFQILKRV